MQPVNPLEPSRRLAALFRARKAVLIQHWRRRVLDDPSVPEANRLSEPELRDSIPTLIDDLVRILESTEVAGRAVNTREAAKEHARHRFAEGYAIAGALRELSHFRAALVALCTEAGMPLEGDAAEVVLRAIDAVMITSAAEMEQAVVAELRHRAEFRERLIGIFGHELRGPLQVIGVSIAALLVRGDTPKHHAEVLRRVSNGIERMGRLISDLLDMTRVQHGGGVPIEPQPADLRAICQDVVEQIATVHPDRAIVLDAMAPVLGTWDPDRLAQVVMNLVQNALEYSPSDKAVRITLREQGPEAIVSVNNQGPTIPAEVMPQLFEPFYRGPEDGRTAVRGGLGLGLFIAKQIVAAHGGSIDVASAQDTGTTFSVRLPRAN